MRNSWVIILGIFLGICSLAPAASWADDMVPASKNPCLKYLPKDWALVGNVDLKTLLNWTRNSAQAPQAAMMDQYVQTCKAFTGIDPGQDLDYATYFVCGDLEKAPKFMAALRGKFNGKTVMGRFAASLGQNAQVTPAKSGAVYVTPNVSYCLTDDGTLLIGDPDEVMRTADIADADRAAIPDSLKNTLDHTNAGAILWIAGLPGTFLQMTSLADWRKDNAELADNLGKMDCCSVFFDDAVDGILVRALGNLASNTEAKKLSDYLNQRKGALMTSEGSNVFGFSVMNVSEIQAGENQVTATLAITAKSIEQIWRTPVILKPGTAIPSSAQP